MQCFGQRKSVSIRVLASDLIVLVLVSGVLDESEVLTILWQKFKINTNVGINNNILAGFFVDALG